MCSLAPLVLLRPVPLPHFSPVANIGKGPIKEGWEVVRLMEEILHQPWGRVVYLKGRGLGLL